MVARLARSTTGYAAQYVGTTRANVPNPTPGSTTCRSFNGAGDRLIGWPSDQIGANFMVVMSIWRAKAEGLANDQTAARLFTQYCAFGTRVAVGINQSSLSITYTNSNGARTTLESKDRILDLARHNVVLLVTTSQILVLLDGRESMRVNVALAPPSKARVNIGADADRRFWNGLIDDLAIYQEAQLPADPENWARFYMALLTQDKVRDYTPALLDGGVAGGTAATNGLTASGVRAGARVALNVPWRTDAGAQGLELKLSGTGPFRLGAYNPDHVFADKDLGDTANSFAWTSDGALLVNGEVSATGLGQWGPANVMAMVWDPAQLAVSLYRDGQLLDTHQLDSKVWRPAITLGVGGAQLNAGQFLPWSTAPVSPLKSRVWSLLSTEYRQMRLDGLALPLDDLDDILRDGPTRAVVGSYNGALPAAPDLEPFAVMRRRGAKINSVPATAADTDFFFAVLFQPTAADLTGEVVLMDQDGKWRLSLVDGKLRGTAAGVTVTASGVAEAGTYYYAALTRNAAGRLSLWAGGRQIAQSSGTFLAGVSGDVWLGQAADGSKPFAGLLSHVLLAGKTPPAWRLARLAKTYTWGSLEPTGLGYNLGRNLGGA